MISRRAFNFAVSSFFVNTDKPRTLGVVVNELMDEKVIRDYQRDAKGLDKEFRYKATADGKPTTTARGLARRMAAAHERFARLLMEIAEL